MDAVREAATARAQDARGAVVTVLTVLLAGLAPTLAGRPPVTAVVVVLLGVKALLVRREASAPLLDALVLTTLLWLLLAVPFTGLWPLPAVGAF